MLFYHKLLAKLGYHTEAYIAEVFKSEHPQYIVISTEIHDAMGRSFDIDDEYYNQYTISAVIGPNVFFARRQRKLYVATGETEVDILVNKYIIVHRYRLRYNAVKRIIDWSSTYRVSFDAVQGGDYRFRFHSDDKVLEIVYEHGDQHKIYTFS